MDLLLFSVGFVGFIVALIFLVISLIRKKPKKMPLIALGVCFVLIMASLSIGGNENGEEIAQDDEREQVEDLEEDNKMELSKEEKELLRESYEDFDSSKRTDFAVILEKVDKIEIDDEFKKEIDRLKEERDEWVQARKDKEKEPENRKKNIEDVIKARIDDGDYYRAKLKKITINDNMGEGGEDTYIALVYFDFDIKNKRETGNTQMRRFSDDLAATLASKGIEDVAEFAVFWTDDYNNRDVKYSYTYRDGSFYIKDIAGE